MTELTETASSDPAPPDHELRPEISKEQARKLLTFVGWVVLAAVLSLSVQSLVVKPYKIPSESMTPTLQVGQRILVDRLSGRFSDPAVGDIIVFEAPFGFDEQRCGNPSEGLGTNTPCGKTVSDETLSMSFIKRVVGEPGDLIAIRAGRVVRNGQLVDEPFADTACAEPELCDFPAAVRVPDGHVYVMGDNRDGSNDSRFWGPVPRGWVIGQAFATYWPVNRIGGL